MKQTKKILALLLALACLLSCLSLPALAADTGFVTNIAGFEEKDAYRLTEDGFYAEASGKGDQFAYSTTSGKDFVYEADVTFNNPDEDGAAALLFRSPKEGSSYIANLNGKTGVARVFKFGDRTDGAVDLAPAGSVQVKESGTYHLKVVAIKEHIVYYVDDTLVLNPADYSVGGWNHGQDDAYLEGMFGLMTWNTNVTYQNVKYTEITDENSPELSKLSVISNDGEVDKQISFSEGQYVYITYVSNDTTSIQLDYAQKGSDGIVTVTDGDGKTVDSTNLPVTKDFETFTLTSEVDGAKVVYRLRVHRGQPDETYYNEDWRGQFHYSVKDGWANDPNGMVYFNGTYHLFYQYYDGIAWGPMHWAHATSTDLIHWEEHPIEFYPDEYGSMFSGCAVVADHATAPALFAEGETGIVIFITANGANGHDDQKLIIAYSKDGETFQKYKEGQVILHWNELEDDLHNGAFRDPKIFRYEGKWFMVLAGGPLRIYSSDNLIDWAVESTYAELGTECPDLYALTVKDADGNDTGEVKWVLSRCGRYYKIGDLKQVDGKWSFVPLEQYASPNAEGMGNDSNDGVMNFGYDSYAAMTYYLADAGVENSFEGNRVIEINWMNSWAYCNAIPGANGNNVFNGTFNLQLELGVQKTADGKYYLTQTPIEEYETLRDTENAVELKDVTIGADNSLLADFSGDSYEIVATVQPNTSKEIGFKVRAGQDQETVIKYDVASGRLMIDRSKSGFIVNSEFANVVSDTASKNADGSFTFHIYVDRSSVEAFNGDYTAAGAMQIFPSPASSGLSVYSDDGSATGDITVYPLNTIWTDKVTPEGPVSITVSQTSTTLYVGDSVTLDSWLSPGGVEQEIEYKLVEDNGVVSLTQNGLKAEVKALKLGTATIRISAKNKPELYKDCTVKVTENNFQTNLSGFEERGGSWFVDGTDYIGSHNDNAFLYSKDFFNCDKLTYEVDVQFESGILNFFFRSVSKNAYDGSYVLQLNGTTVRLFDFKGDYTFVELPGALEKADSYHIKIELDGQDITVTINDKEYIKRTITEEDRQYKNGYVALGLFFAEAHFQNFYVNSGESRSEGNFQTNLKDFESTRGYWYVDGEDYIGTLPDNAFLYSDYIDSDHFTYTADAQFNSNCLNLIFQSQAKDPWAGCYALQVHIGEKKVRLFDFKGDVTFAEVRDVLPEAESYHIEIRVDGQHITAKVNGVEYIDTIIEDADHLYNSGYVALGFWNTEARFQNFYVQDNPFTDVRPDVYYADAVTWAYKNGVAMGTSDTTFSPDGLCTRAEFVTFLWRAAGEPEPASAESPFSDVSAAAYPNYYKAILWANEEGIAKGTSTGTFNPDGTVTRAEAVTFMYRYAQKAGIADKSGAVSFDDVKNEGAMVHYYDAIGWAVANGITKGNSTTTNTFGPMDGCLRGQMVTFLHRLFAETIA